MKKTLSILMVLALGFALVACGGSGNSGQSVASGSNVTVDPNRTPRPSTDSNVAASFATVNSGKLTMSTNAAFPPYEMVADDGSFEGIDVEVAEVIAELLGLELEVDDMSFDAALLAAQNGQSDIVMAGVSVTDERLEVMDFTDSYANAVQVIIVTEDSPVTTVDDLAEVDMIGCQRGTTGYQYCAEDYGEDHVTAYETGATAIQALKNGQVDCVVIDNLPAQEYVKANTGLQILDTEYANEDYAIGLAKGNTALLNAINGALAQLEADGTLQAIVDKYINAN